MATNLQELGREFQDLAARSLEEQMRAVQRYNGLMQKLGRGELPSRPAGDDYLRFVGEETTRYVGAVASLVLSYYKELFELGRAYNERFYEGMVGDARRGGASSPEAAAHQAPPPVSRRRVDVTLDGVVGQDATRTFVLESRRAEPAEIYFVVSDFVGPEGAPAFRAELEFQPARFTLRPGEERVVTMRLPLRAALFRPGLSYTATALVRGYEDLELCISVTPAAAAEGAQPPAPTEPHA